MGQESEAERLAAEKQYFDAVLDSMSDGVLVCDSAMRVTKFNSAAEQITGWSRIDAIGAPCPDIFHGYLCGHGCALERTAAGNDGVRDQEVMIQHRNGEQRLIVLTTSAIRAADGGALGVVAVFRDITELARLRTELRGRAGFPNLVGRSPAMRTLYEQIEDVAASEASVLLLGETGVGKELVAEAIHRASRRAGGPLIKVNCSALSEGLLESELFGHVRGAFTGALRDKVGRFELANGGSIFLDEIGELSPSLQVKLLRVLQEKEIERVGEARVIPVDCRVIAATNRDLRARVDRGTFREDLFYRLSVIPIHVPPLRDRRADIPLLAEHFLTRIATQEGKPVEGFTPDAIDALLEYRWPGNVRELENAIAFAIIKCRAPRIGAEHLPAEIRSAPRAARSGAGTLTRDAIEAALQKTGGNRLRAARALGVGRATFYRKVAELGIDIPTKR
ncbi:MAG TPA: sigma 54-interacting transcriptional regulator [Candidatus Margulisiibacteriota bacterium]|nr:sigma 54-interacting transcriptional regulator [Candidatus Margulisiibacteriota bacterium]